jgi:ABC-type sugar transport system permease subunit
LIFFAGPLLLSLYFSFTNWDAFGTRDWIGLDNYAKLFNVTMTTLDSADQLAREAIDVTVYDELSRFTLFGTSYIIGAEDKLFWISLRNTIKYVLLVVPLAVIPALFLANLLNSKLRGMKFFRSAYFVPSIAAVVGIALVWQWLYNSQIGYINYFITSAVNFLNGLGFDLNDPQIRWLSDSRFALISVIIMAGWQMIGFNTVLFLAGLQQIPGELYEAATVDGAGSWRKFWNLTLPMLAPTTFFVLTTTVIRAMQVFEEIFILIPTNPAGPNNSTLSIVLYLYQKGFQRFEQGYASAIAWVLFLLIFGATLFQFQRQRRAGSGYEV